MMRQILRNSDVVCLACYVTSGWIDPEMIAINPASASWTMGYHTDLIDSFTGDRFRVLIPHLDALIYTNFYANTEDSEVRLYRVSEAE